MIKAVTERSECKLVYFQNKTLKMELCYQSSNVERYSGWMQKNNKRNEVKNFTPILATSSKGSVNFCDIDVILYKCQSFMYHGFVRCKSSLIFSY